MSGDHRPSLGALILIALVALIALLLALLARPVAAQRPAPTVAPLMPSLGLGWAIQVEAPISGLYVLIRHDDGGPQVEGPPFPLVAGTVQSIRMRQPGYFYHVQVFDEPTARMWESVRHERAAFVALLPMVAR